MRVIQCLYIGAIKELFQSWGFPNLAIYRGIYDINGYILTPAPILEVQDKC